MKKVVATSSIMSEEKINQELSDDELKNVAGGFSELSDYTTIGEQFKGRKKQPGKGSISEDKNNEQNYTDSGRITY